MQGAKGKMRQTGPIWALGTMSGTSLDGVDGAMILTDGHAILDFGPSAYRPYTEAEAATIRAGFGLWPRRPRLWNWRMSNCCRGFRGPI